MKSNQTVTSKFADKIKIKFHDINLLENALTHRSYLNSTTILINQTSD